MKTEAGDFADVSTPDQIERGEPVFRACFDVMLRRPHFDNANVQHIPLEARIINIVAEWQPEGWAIVVNISTEMPNGQVVNSIGAIDINEGGDLLFQFANGVNSLAVSRDGKFTL